MVDVLVAILVILGLSAGWIYVQHLSHEFARRHPELGPAREEGGGCGTSCQCSSGGQCSKKSDQTTQQDIKLT